MIDEQLYSVCILHHHVVRADRVGVYDAVGRFIRTGIGNGKGIVSRNRDMVICSHIHADYGAAAKAQVGVLIVNNHTLVVSRVKQPV